MRKLYGLVCLHSSPLQCLNIPPTFDIYFRLELILVIMLQNRRDTQATYRLILKLLYVIIYVKKMSSVRYKSNIIAFLF